MSTLLDFCCHGPRRRGVAVVSILKRPRTEARLGTFRSGVNGVITIGGL